MQKSVLDAFDELSYAKVNLLDAEVNVVMNQEATDDAKREYEKSLLVAKDLFAKYDQFALILHESQVLVNTSSAAFEAAATKLSQAIASPPNPQV